MFSNTKVQGNKTLETLSWNCSYYSNTIMFFQESLRLSILAAHTLNVNIYSAPPKRCAFLAHFNEQFRKWKCHAFHPSVPKEFQGCFMVNSKKFNGCFKKVSKVLKSIFISVSENFQGYIKEVVRILGWIGEFDGYNHRTSKVVLDEQAFCWG